MFALTSVLGLTVPGRASAATMAPDSSTAQLSLPWATGGTWTLLNGPHEWASDTNQAKPWNSLDLTKSVNTHDPVVAARGGIAHIPSCAKGFQNGQGWVVIDHQDGWLTSYFHISGVPQSIDGNFVARGQFLGYTDQIADPKPGCGGNASGFHVHFSVFWHPGGYTGFDPNATGQQVDLSGFIIGGWRISEGATSLSGCMTRIRDGHPACAHSGQVLNDGTIGNGSSGFPADPLRNAGFELGTFSGWAKFNPSGGITNIAVYNTAGRAKEGSWFLASNTSATSGGSLYQDVPVATGPGQTYSFSIWARVPPGQTGPYSIQLSLFGLGGSKQEGDSTYVSVGSSWQLISVSLSPTVAHTSMRAQIYLHTAATTINFDGATFASGNQAEA